jgi:integrase/recombinase XerD
MIIKEATTLFRYYQQSHHRKRTIDSYQTLVGTFEKAYGNRSLESLQPDEMYQFLEHFTEGAAKSTRRLRYAQLKAFFNFIIEKCHHDMKNPCDAPLLSKTFSMPRQVPRTILDKETVDEMIYNTKNPRNRLILELQARCGLRIGELLNIKAQDVSERKLTIKQPKSGKEAGVAFMPEPIANRMSDYLKRNNFLPDNHVFPISYSTARMFIKKLGTRLNVSLSPHDLRRYSATYASRNGVPLEIVSKDILRHQDLKTTQIYLGKISEHEAIRWMDILHGK